MQQLHSPAPMQPRYAAVMRALAAAERSDLRRTIAVRHAFLYKLPPASRSPLGYRP